MGDREQGNRRWQEAKPGPQAEKLSDIYPDFCNENVLSWGEFEYDPRPKSNFTTFDLPQEIALSP
jgi:hypothetical protein